MCISILGDFTVVVEVNVGARCPRVFPVRSGVYSLATDSKAVEHEQTSFRFLVFNATTCLHYRTTENLQR